MLTASTFVACGGNITSKPLPQTPTPVPTTIPTTAPNGNPTTAPTTVPTTTPNSTLSVSPSSLSLKGLGAAYAQTLTATETGNAGTLTTSGCATVATATVGALGATTLITVTGVGSGTCTLVVADANGQRVAIGVGVMTAPPPTSTPTPTPTTNPTAAPTTLTANYYPMFITNNSQLSGQALNVYVYGQYPAGGPYYYLTALNGTNAQTVANTAIPPLHLTSGGELDLPPLYGARIYVALNGGTLQIAAPTNGGGPQAPAPYVALDPSIGTVFDFLEYTYDPAASANFNLDLTQVDGMGLPWSFHWAPAGQANDPELGLKPNGISAMASQLQSLPAPWPQLVQNVGSVQRIINPQHLIAGSESGQTANPVVSISGSFMTGLIDSMFSTFSNSDLVIGGFPVPGGVTWYGRVTNYPVSPTLTFYNVPSTQSPQPSNVVATYTGLPTAFDALSNSNWFINGTPGPAGSVGDVGLIGRWLSTDLIRDTFDASLYPTSTQHPVCGSTNLNFPFWGNPTALAVSAGFYGGGTTSGGTVPTSSVVIDWYSALAHANAWNQAIYGFPDDDTCNFYASDFGVPTSGHTSGDKFVVTINPF